MSLYMCPHCGWKYDPGAVPREGGISAYDLVPTHDWPQPCRQVCPGSRQTPRNAESDRRPLWKDGGVQ